MSCINFLIETKEWDRLKKNEVKLTDEERKEVFKQKAVWRNGPNHAETSAVWKSVDKNGKVTYITHTFRAFNTAPTLKRIIARFHNFIKGTS